MIKFVIDSVVFLGGGYLALTLGGWDGPRASLAFGLWLFVQAGRRRAIWMMVPAVTLIVCSALGQERLGYTLMMLYLLVFALYVFLLSSARAFWRDRLLSWIEQRERQERQR